MAKAKRKKSRRRKKKRAVVQAKSAPQVRPAAVEAAPTQPKARPAPTQPKARAKAARYQVDFRQEYPYIYSDLKRVGIIALAMLIFMVALSFIL